VLAISLIDVHIFELARQQRSEQYQSFAHTFVLGVGSEGVVIWQAWGDHGYGFDEYIKRGDARIPSWQEAGDFMNAFESFAEYKVTIQRICLLRRKEGNDGTDFHYRANGTRNATKFNKNAFMSISCRLVEIMGRQDRLCRK
jgi:hypothetical protein